MVFAQEVAVISFQGGLAARRQQFIYFTPAVPKVRASAARSNLLADALGDLGRLRSPTIDMVLCGGY